MSSIKLYNIKANIADLAEEMEAHAERINRREELNQEGVHDSLVFTRRYAKLIEALQVLNHICFENIDN
jgi:pyruvate-formate lyase